MRTSILESWQRDFFYHTGNCQFFCGLGWHQSKQNKASRKRKVIKRASNPMRKMMGRPGKHRNTTARGDRRHWSVQRLLGHRSSCNFQTKHFREAKSASTASCSGARPSTGSRERERARLLQCCSIVCALFTKADLKCADVSASPCVNGPILGLNAQQTAN